MTPEKRNDNNELWYCKVFIKRFPQGGFESVENSTDPEDELAFFFCFSLSRYASDIIIMMRNHQQENAPDYLVIEIWVFA